MDKKRAIECIKHFEDIYFTEEVEGESTIGYVDDHNRHIDIQYLEDNIGKYIALVFAIERKNNASKVSDYLSRWIVNGHHKVLADRIILYSVVPVLDEQLLEKQIRHALLEIWDMNNIARNAPE